MRKTFTSKALIVVAVVLGAFMLFAAWVSMVGRWMESVAPGGDNLADCLAKLPAPSSVSVFTQEGEEYLALWGTVQVLPRLPSGPPVYIFDRTGRLVGCTLDSGDSEWFWSLWPGLSSRRVMSRDELMRWPGATR